MTQTTNTIYTKLTVFISVFFRTVSTKLIQNEVLIITYKLTKLIIISKVQINQIYYWYKPLTLFIPNEVLVADICRVDI